MEIEPEIDQRSVDYCCVIAEEQTGNGSARSDKDNV
jgi:hypothetical protein